MSSFIMALRQTLQLFTGMETDTSARCVSGRVCTALTHSTVACTTILGSSMSFLLCTILSSS